MKRKVLQKNYQSGRTFLSCTFSRKLVDILYGKLDASSDMHLSVTQALQTMSPLCSYLRRESFVKCPGWIDAFKNYASNEAVLLLLADRR